MSIIISIFVSIFIYDLLFYLLRANMKTACVVGTIEYGDFVLSKEILDKFHLNIFYKNISDINKLTYFNSINSVYNHYIKGVKQSEELIIYGIEIPVISMVHEEEDSYYEYELADIYIKKFTNYMFQKCGIDYETPHEQLCFSGEDLDLLFLKTKKIKYLQEIELYNIEYEDSEVLCLEFILKSELKMDKNLNTNNNIISKLANDLSKEIILLIAKSKYHLLSNTMNIKEDENITLSYYIENNYVNLEVNTECSIESLNNIIKTDSENNCHRINTKWLKFIKRKLKKKYQFIEKITLNNHYEEKLNS